jgi:hypothetical protein
MTTHPVLMGLTLLNLILLAILLFSRTPLALAYTAESVLRGSALEIVDSRGRVRASIKVQPGETFKPTGRKYAETVMLRLIDPNGRPEVKIGASIDGGGLSLVGDADTIQLLLQADSTGSSIRLRDGPGRERLLQPGESQ